MRNQFFEALGSPFRELSIYSNLKLFPTPNFSRVVSQSKKNQSKGETKHCSKLDAYLLRSEFLHFLSNQDSFLAGWPDRRISTIVPGAKSLLVALLSGLCLFKHLSGAWPLGANFTSTVLSRRQRRHVREA